MTAKLGTEDRDSHAKGFDTLPPTRILEVLAAAQIAAARSVEAAIPAIAEAAGRAAAALASGHRLAYVGAGSSGLMALADCLELPGTYGIGVDEAIVVLAGGRDSLVDMVGAGEDDVAAGSDDLAAAGIGAGDCVIAVSASGSTPYTLAAARAAKERGATVIGIANNEGAPLLAAADVAVLLATPPEVVSGSTRMGAGTAQKIAFNMLSTLMAVHLGHVHDGHMVNVRADNDKLRARAARIVTDIAGIPADAATGLLRESRGSVKHAILLAAGAGDIEAADAALVEAGQNLRRAMSLVAKS
ncbi:N-acetylmuramic acid 6-phosphate etherase [Pleomorphomonas carboxyditropha]|uniref:N-acetylmuramic acid 6-phosphate etherase n=1 Tax=Pleomorphomonas carboxyditropha TaxID=2023338 RepID=A0A2G9WWS4_9HYPH|nr:N-acetylmuramic acid 6-phosphate etherase [Pleomorphomonas carboxyditropha]PIO99157.1 N-acetylmuramic acid 6-phosphate etherase [Pleomorphomonas carboxyditropha]